MNKNNIKGFLKTLINFVIFSVIQVIYIILKPFKRYANLFCILVRHSIWKVKLASLGKNTNIYPSVVIHSPENVRIGDNVAIAEFVHIWGGGGVKIGNYTLIASHAVITSLTHDANSNIYAKTLVKKPVIIDRNVWIGSGAIIQPGVTIGEGAIIGAGSVVTHNVEPDSVVAGAPAKLLRYIKRD